MAFSPTTLHYMTLAIGFLIEKAKNRAENNILLLYASYKSKGEYSRTTVAYLTTFVLLYVPVNLF